jgi:hypothetical protein
MTKQETVALLERVASFIETHGEWDDAKALRAIKLPGRPCADGVTPRQAEVLQLRADVIAAGGNFMALVNDPRIPAGKSRSQRADFLRKLPTFEGRPDLRKSYEILISSHTNFVAEDDSSL